MSVNLFSSKEISIIANFAQLIKLGEAHEIGQALAEQNVAAFNFRHTDLNELVNFSHIPDIKISEGGSLTALVYELMTNSFTTQNDTPANILLSRILKNSIAIEFGEQIHLATVGKQCRVTHCYALINYVVADLGKAYKIATYDDDRQSFRVFNSHKSAVSLLNCNQLSAQQVDTLLYNLERPILEGKSVFIENCSLTVFKNHPDNFFTIELKELAPAFMGEKLIQFNATIIGKNIWKVSNDIIYILRELCPRGSVHV